MQLKFNKKPILSIYEFGNVKVKPFIVILTTLLLLSCSGGDNFKDDTIPAPTPDSDNSGEKPTMDRIELVYDSAAYSAPGDTIKIKAVAIGIDGTGTDISNSPATIWKIDNDADFSVTAGELLIKKTATVNNTGKLIVTYKYTSPDTDNANPPGNNPGITHI